MIGAGVFLKTRVMTCNVGSAKMVMLVWVAAGLLSLAGSFSYSEIAAMMPEAGGDYVYLRRAYGRIMGFLFGWMAFAVFRTGAQAALAVGLAIFMNVALGGALQRWHIGGQFLGMHLQVGGLTLIALATIWTVALINCASVSTGGRTALLATIAKVALVLGIGIGAFLFAPGDWTHLDGSGLLGSCEGVAASARGGIAGFGAAMLGALWAYDGWNNVAPLAGEIRDPQRNLPRAFIGGMLVVGALYLFVNTAYYYALSPLEIADIPTSSSVATEVLKRFLGPVAVSLTAVALMVSSFGSLHASVLANSRIPFAMARDGLFFRGLAKLSPHSNVPVRAILAQAVWAQPARRFRHLRYAHRFGHFRLLAVLWTIHGIPVRVPAHDARCAASLSRLRLSGHSLPVFIGHGRPAGQYLRRSAAPGAAGRGIAAARAAVLLVLGAPRATR